MTDPLGEHNLVEYLTAFADGELDAAQNLAVLDYLTRHPEAIALMREQQQLRLATHRALRRSGPEVPDALRQRIERLAQDAQADAAPVTPTPAPVEPAPPAPRRSQPLGEPPRRRGRSWLTLGVAASLAVGLIGGAIVARYLFPPRQGDPRIIVEKPPEPPKPVVPVQLVVAATRVHVDCSRVAERLHAKGYPAAHGPLADLVEQDLSSEKPHPDLSAIGFDFIGAGPCAQPLENTIHLLYKARGTEPRKTISVFVQANRGQFQLAPGQLHVLAGPDSAFPMYAWRSNDVVYFLLADQPELIDRARKLIPSAPPPVPA